MGSAPSAPASTTTQATTTNLMDPQLYALLYGNPNAPGAQTIANASQNQQVASQAQAGNTGALATLFGVPSGGDYQSYMPQSAVPTTSMPYAQSTPAQIAAASNLGTGGSGSGSNAQWSPSAPPTTPAKSSSSESTQESAKGGWQGGKDSYADGSTVSTGTQTGQPYSMAQALFNQSNQYYDPTTGLSTNPYFNQAVNTLSGTQMPQQYGAASTLANTAGNALLGASGYQPQQIQNQQIQAAQAQGPMQWNAQAANQYMSPYEQTALQSQINLSQNMFQPQLQQIQSNEAESGAYGGARGAIAEQQAQLNQNLNLNNLIAQGMNTAYTTGQNAFQNQNLLQTQTNLANATNQQQANVQNAANNLTAQTQNQQAGLTANQQNLSALNQAGNLATPLTAAGQAQFNYGNQMAQNWGNAGTALQNSANAYGTQQQQNAQNYWNAVPLAGQAATNTLLGSPWGSSSGSQTTSTPNTVLKKGGYVKAPRGVSNKSKVKKVGHWKEAQ